MKPVLMASLFLVGCSSAGGSSSSSSSAGGEFPETLPVKVVVSSFKGSRDLDSTHQKMTLRATLPRTNSSKNRGVYQLSGLDAGIVVTDAIELQTATGEGPDLDTLTTPVTKLSSVSLYVEIEHEKGVYDVKVIARVGGEGTQTLTNRAGTQTTENWPITLSVDFPEKVCGRTESYGEATGTPMGTLSLTDEAKCTDVEVSNSLELE
ncbi:MAG: hypothetical protein ACO1OB_18215 [Archangium sp.]